MGNRDQNTRLTLAEERRIDGRIRIGIIIFAAVVVAFLIWSVATKHDLGLVYRILVISFLVCNWLFTDVLSIYWKHGFAGRSEEQKKACKEMILFGLFANIGLGWFLLTMSTTSLFGALIYFFAIQSQRKARERYETEPEDEESPEEGSPEEAEAAVEERKDAESAAVTAAESASSDAGQDAADALPTAANRKERSSMTAAERLAELGIRAEQDLDESAEDTDGSV